MIKTWKDIQKTAERNALFLDQQPEDFLESDARLAEGDLILLLLLLIDDFETEDGRIKKNRKNFFMVNRIDQVFTVFAAGAGFALIGKLIDRFNNILTNNFSYFKTLLGNTELFRETKASGYELYKRRLGLDAQNKLVKDGYLKSLYDDTSIRNEAREIYYRGVLAGNKPADLREEVTKFIEGDGKDTKGAIQKFYSKFAYDTFGQIDRMTSAHFAQQYGLKWFIYFGVIIKNSRAFCRKHINGLFNTEEAKLWPYESPAPIGISTATYDPVIDLGGKNCKHMAVFVTDEVAEDLKERFMATASSDL